MFQMVPNVPLTVIAYFHWITENFATSLEHVRNVEIVSSCGWFNFPWWKQNVSRHGCNEVPFVIRDNMLVNIKCQLYVKFLFINEVVEVLFVKYCFSFRSLHRFTEKNEQAFFYSYANKKMNSGYSNRVIYRKEIAN